MTNKTVEVRELQAADRARWDELWAGYLEYYRHDLPRDITEYTWQRLLDPQAPLHALVAVNENSVVGLVHYLFHESTWSVKGYCYLEDLFVDPAARGKGIGRALIEAVYRAADAYGATRVYWHTESENQRAQGLYNQIATLTPFIQYRRK
jgi:GNAT superfamily N-acetyltransferase